MNRAQEAILEDRIVAEVPGERGFWTNSAENAFLDAGRMLINRGFTLMETLELLTELYGATAGDFGG